MFGDAFNRFMNDINNTYQSSVRINGVPHLHSQTSTSRSRNYPQNHPRQDPSSSRHHQTHGHHSSSSRRRTSSSSSSGNSRQMNFGQIESSLDQIFSGMEQNINARIESMFDFNNFPYGNSHNSRTRTTSSSSSSSRNQNRQEQRAADRRDGQTRSARSLYNRLNEISRTIDRANREERERRRERRMRQETQDRRNRGHREEGRSSRNRGLTDDQIKTLKRHEYTKQDDECTICMDDFVMSYVVRTLPCKHYFHADCIDPWLRQNASCPTCRANVVIPT
ncbi:Oidioi.mRNA.OKI2018_I69.chr1.g3587.t1.cds [Oikopleura dioica]|uniref:Oidioi.mRNA.OKI2018_I69.chr1.g3587.t1.cds n=1 Tax=Oikopleura dioica TaxID=34765 RepID=A0ABN7SWB9_OIKDI|nr:Oidioi.mRNA.OKI2018_I69.chr1.g3587.t1.cds [Oikopleura dioica]